MNRVATCPRCKTAYELDEDDIGHLMECECGAALFACHTRSLDVFEIWCSDCGSAHQVPGAEAGRMIEVDCGQTVCVPSVMLRLPVGNRELAARANALWQQQRKSDPEAEACDRQSAASALPIRPSTSSADGDSYRLRGDRLRGDRLRGVRVRGDSSIEGEKGYAEARSYVSPTSAVHSTLRSGNKLNNSPDSGDNGGKATGLASDFGGKAKKTGASRRNPGSTLAGVAVAALFIAAVVIFLLRESPSQKRANRSKVARKSPTPNGIHPKSNAQLKLEMVIAGDGMDLVSEDLVVSRLPAAKVPSVPLVDNVRADGTRGSYQLPPPTIYALPAQKQPRERITVQRSKSAFFTLQSAMDAAFEQYGRVQKLKEQVDTSNSQADVDAYQKAIGRTIGVIEQVHQLAVAKAAVKETATTRYLLAYLYFKAGMLPEAAVMGEAVVRWGELDDPSTKEAGMIALAATQELTDLHWGDAEDLGELRQMEAIAKILQRRWPAQSQNDLIWMNIGYLYEAFNQPQNAVRVYENILQSSEHYGNAGLASGMAEWSVLRQRQAVTNKIIDAEARKRVKQRLVKALRLVEKNDSRLAISHVEARLALAQMDLIAGNPEKAEQWLTLDPHALLSSIRVREEDKDESKLIVVEALARELYEVLFHACNEQGDTKGATQAMDELAVLLGNAGEELATRKLSILKAAFENLKRTDEMQQAAFDAAREISSGIMSDASMVPTATIIWLGESWAQVGEQAGSAGKAGQDRLAKDAARMAADLFDFAIKRNDFPQESLQAAQLRRVELLRRSGEVMRSLKQIEDMLADEPNVFTLQIAAAQCLQQVAVEYGRSSDLLAAIDGPSGFSPIWGWGKLVTTLHTSMYSDSGTPRNAEQLALAQYNLFWCRYQVASQITDTGEQTRQLGKVEQALTRRIATMDDRSEWYPRYKDLFDQMSSDK
ncbi:MAG: hypothetical protein CMM01_17860 [Rhodopirellula sp.]|nr:hypothetical protein [Rhodopirellula sp.]